MKNKIVIIIYLISLFIFTVYSYSLIDPNLTLLNSQAWVFFRDIMVNFGYYLRNLSANSYLLLIILLTFAHLFLIKNHKKIPVVKLALAIGLITIFSYPFLSHDLFNYIFDAKILTFYGKNPYLFAPRDFPQDEWLRFMHWIHRSYPYGPTFLPLTLIPSYISMGKFILNFLFFKVFFATFYFFAVFFMAKISKKSALIFATHPLIIIEGLINSHNDLISVSLGIIGVYLILKKGKKISSKIFFLLSAGIKYLTLPTILISKNKKINLLSFVLQIALIIYLCTTRELQPWYFLPVFIFLPIFPNIIDNMKIFLFGLLLSYYPFIKTGVWDYEQKLCIIFAFLATNIFYIIYTKRRKIKSYFLKK